ncbi:hypothetical protein MMC19_001312 [Ptychographa xylographoides]|nr:hypothetical protein [Ptychographa xylographoides]
MSLGPRIHNRCRVAATNYLRVASRDTLRSHCAKLSSLALARIPHATSDADNFLTDQIDGISLASHEPHSILNTNEKAYQVGQFALSREGSRASFGPAISKGHNASKQIAIAKGAPVVVENSLEHDYSNRDFSSLKQALLKPTIKSPQKEHRSKRDRIRRHFLFGTERSHGDTKIVQRIPAKATGSWSYDWGIAFDELKEHYRKANPQVPVSIVIRRYLLGESPNYTQTRAQDIPHPKFWSQLTFEEHIKSLTKSTVTRLMHRHIYAGDTHVEAVHDTLFNLLEDESLRPYISPKAIITSFNFLYKHEKIASVRKLFSLFDTIGHDFTQETFNVMLRAAALRNDLHNFTYLLRVMVQKGLPPNPSTWVAFLMVLPDRDSKMFIMDYMKAAGVLTDKSDLRNAVCQVVDIEVADHIGSGQDVTAFLQRMRSRYGPQWLSLPAVNTICHLLGKHGLISQAFEALRIAAVQGHEPDNVSLHICLGHCRRLRQPSIAVRVLKLFRSRYGITPKDKEFDHLFMLAWRARYMNACRVIWRASCLEGAVSYRMQELVLRSLVRNTPEYPVTGTQRWMKMAGKVIVGIDLKTGKASNDPKYSSEVMQKLFCWSDTGDERNNALKLAKQILARDLDGIRHYKPIESFTELFSKAVDLDDDWESDGDRATSIEWKLTNAIEVRIEVHAHAWSIPRPLQKVIRKVMI